MIYTSEVNQKHKQTLKQDTTLTRAIQNGPQYPPATDHLCGTIRFCPATFTSGKSTTDFKTKNNLSKGNFYDY